MLMENIIAVKPKEYYQITYNVPKELKAELDMYIEECVGADGIALIDDCTETETSTGYEGALYLSFDEDYPYNECYLEEVASTLLTLSNGESCIVGIEE